LFTDIIAYYSLQPAALQSSFVAQGEKEAKKVLFHMKQYANCADEEDYASPFGFDVGAVNKKRCFLSVRVAFCRYVRLRSLD